MSFLVVGQKFCVSATQCAAERLLERVGAGGRVRTATTRSGLSDLKSKALSQNSELKARKARAEAATALGCEVAESVPERRDHGFAIGFDSNEG